VICLLLFPILLLGYLIWGGLVAIYYGIAFFVNAISEAINDARTAP
jgi:hypothetical protein